MTFIMSKDLIFRVAFWVIFCGMIVIQGIFALRLRLVGESKIADRIAIEREGWSFMIVRFIRSLLLIAFLVLYAVNHPWLVILKIGFPDFVRWMGVALGVLSLALYVWSRLTLGKEWSSCLQMRNQHHLINTGPYARIIPTDY